MYNEEIENKLMENIRNKGYKSAFIKCAIVKEAVAWQNCVTKIVLQEKEVSITLKKSLENENFVIFETEVDIEKLKEIIKNLYENQQFSLESYEINQLQSSFNDPVFSGNFDATKDLNIAWGIENYLITGKTLYQFPKINLLNRGYHTISDAINDNFNLNIKQEHSSSIYIILPNYEARIKEFYNLDENIYALIEKGTKEFNNLQMNIIVKGDDKQYKRKIGYPISNNTNVIQMNHPFIEAELFILDECGKTIDKTKVETPLSIYSMFKNIATYRSSFDKTPEISPEDRKMVSDDIIRHTKYTKELSQKIEKTDENCIDGFDLEIIKSIKANDGQYAHFMPDVINSLPTHQDLIFRLARLKSLNYIQVLEDRIVLTIDGMNLLSTLPDYIQANIPVEITKKLMEIRMEFKKPNYAEVKDKGTKLIEGILRKEFEDKFGDSIEKNWREKVGGASFDRASLGHLLYGAIKLNILKENDISSCQIKSFNELRIPETHENKERLYEINSIGIMMMKSIELFARSWYYKKH